MLNRRPFVRALFYVPLKRCNVQEVMRRCTVRLEPIDQSNYEDERIEEDERAASPDNEELKLYDLSKRGFIGVPRTYGIETFGHLGYVNLTTRLHRTPELFPKTIKPRDSAQEQFWRDLRHACMGPLPVDVIANATTGAGKTVTALWLQQECLQAPILVTVPTNYLKRQWIERITEFRGKEWVKRYVGIIQQDEMDYDGRLLCIGLAPSLAFRDYPKKLREHFGAILFDEWHKVGAPRMSNILHKYPASIRVALTATNRRDALLKVCKLHMGEPRVVSTQEVLKPTCYVVPYQRVLPRNMPIFSEYSLIDICMRDATRNDLLLKIIYERGVLRGRKVLVLSDRVRHLQHLQSRIVNDFGVPDMKTGLVVGEYETGEWKTTRAGNRKKVKIKMTSEEQALVAQTSDIVFATYGVMDTGADVSHLDMGVEATPRSNLRQAIGRVLRILPGKPTPEWYSVDDTVLSYGETSSTIFADPTPMPVLWFEEKKQHRRSSFQFHKAEIRLLELPYAH